MLLSFLLSNQHLTKPLLTWLTSVATIFSLLPWEKWSAFILVSSILIFLWLLQFYFFPPLNLNHLAAFLRGRPFLSLLHSTWHHSCCSHLSFTALLDTVQSAPSPLLPTTSPLTPCLCFEPLTEPSSVFPHAPKISWVKLWSDRKVLFGHHLHFACTFYSLIFFSFLFLTSFKPSWGFQASIPWAVF